MPKPSILLLSLLGLLAAIIAFVGLADKKLLFITSPRIAAISLAAVGFLMCSVGALSVYIAKAPAHPLAIAGYVLGAFALYTAAVQVFHLKAPLVSEPKAAIAVLAAIVLIKFIIGRLSVLISLKA